MSSTVDSEIQFNGTISNASGTPLNEAGGLAVFEGVMMKSRTGFAIAQRRPDGSISVSQFPWRSLAGKSGAWRLPFLRGAASLSEMMVIGTRAMQFSTEIASSAAPSKPMRSWFDAGIATSIIAMIFFLVVIPDLIPSLVSRIGSPGVLFNEADQPIIFNLFSGLVRLLILVGYIVALSLSADIRRVFQYHGAEHKAVLALEEGRDVTVARARAHDTLHPRCGTTFLALLALLCIPLFALVDTLLMLYVSGFPSWTFAARKLTQFAAHALMLPVVICSVFELIKVATPHMRKWWARLILAPGFFLQRLTTRQPNDQQLEVAIVALFGALAISPAENDIKKYVVRGLTDDDSAPGYVARTPARVLPKIIAPPTSSDPQPSPEVESRQAS